jgi:hypothetical protein
MYKYVCGIKGRKKVERGFSNATSFGLNFEESELKQTNKSLLSLKSYVTTRLMLQREDARQLLCGSGPGKTSVELP